MFENMELNNMSLNIYDEILNNSRFADDVMLRYGTPLTLTKKRINKIQVTQVVMERSIFGLFFQDRVLNTQISQISQRTITVDAVGKITSLKWN